MFRKTIVVCKRFVILLYGGNTALLFKAISTWAKKFAVIVREHRPIRWADHQSYILSELAIRGVLEHMTDCKLMTEAECDKVLVVNVFDNFEPYGRFFCLLNISFVLFRRFATLFTVCC